MTEAIELVLFLAAHIAVILKLRAIERKVNTLLTNKAETERKG
jgi:hypothetical protein